MDEHSRKLLNLSDAAVAKLDKLHVHTLWDLVLHMPLRYEDDTVLTPLKDLRVGERALIEGRIVASEVHNRPRRQLVVALEDDGGHALFLRFIHFYPSQIKQLSVGKRIRAAGEVRRGFWGDEMIHPKISPAGENLPSAMTPIYPTVAGLAQSSLRRFIQIALKKLPLDDTLPETVLRELGLPSFADAVRFLHAPTPDFFVDDLNARTVPAWQRLKSDELLAQQLSMRLARDRREAQTAVPLRGDGSLCEKLRARLPFALTPAQEKCLLEIQKDMARPRPMNRLLQGDVGSGKTVVAALAALTAVEAGFQVALMAPTEILAEQHAEKFRRRFEDLGLSMVHLSGSLKKKDKEKAVSAISSGEAKIAVGTHALFQREVNFRRLGLVIIDEQHRFGVEQRIALKNKGSDVHQLMMSATPIPRTLAMGFFADLDISVIDSAPPQRQVVETKLINSARRAAVEAFTERTVREGRQVYWVCPLIEESEKLQLQTAVETFDRLQSTFPELSVGLVHGRMKPEEKNEVMSRFVSGSLNILVATTVIEVGVDVPNAALMIIENAERMGLSQLHQLRGRVGRGGGHAVCVLLFSEPLSDLSRERLKIIFENNDGFEIARLDLALRGPGEFLGARQSGMPLLRFADLQKDVGLMTSAQKIASEMIEQNLPAVQKHLDRWLPDRDDYLGA